MNSVSHATAPAVLLACLVSSSVHAGPGGACCLVSECVDVADVAQCNALGGVLLEGESCATAPCGVGACCFELNCNMTDAFSCITAGREFAGAGTSCLDDPCDAGVGACCFADGTCLDNAPEDCGLAGGTWLGAGTSCAGAPCALGACCIGQSCTDGARHECDASGGVFLEGAVCADDPCTPPNDCPSPSLFGQQRDEPDDFTAGTSEVSAGFRRFEDFTGVAGAIEGLVWWGVDLQNIGGNDFIECDERELTFEIAFHEDAGGQPGVEVCSYVVTATETPLGILYLGAELKEYAVTLPQPCVLVHGWVSIVGAGDPSCWFLWMSAGPGSSWCDGCGASQESFDLSLCLQGTEGGVFGACCTEATGVCADGVEIIECTAIGQRFVPGESCAELDPPCGVILGACCLPDAACTQTVQADCSALGGTWLGASTLCAQCPCVAVCPDGALAEGEPTCFDGYVDTVNGGCFSNPAVFIPVELGQTICGESGIYLSGIETPDVDAYELVIGGGPQQVDITIVAEFQPRLLLVDGTLGCPGTTIADVVGVECEEVALFGPLDPGTYWILVLPAAFTDTAACGAGYTIDFRVLCLADIDGSGAVNVTDLLLLLGDWGPCPGCPTDLDGNGVVDVSDLLILLANWGTCGA